MRFIKGCIMLLIPMLICGAALACVDRAFRDLGSDLRGLFGSVRELEQEWELSEKLEEELQLVTETRDQKYDVMEALLQKRYGLREATARYLTLCVPADIESLRITYQQPTTPENDLIAWHLIILAERDIKATGQYEDRLPQLQREWLQLCDEPPARLLSGT